MIKSSKHIIINMNQGKTISLDSLFCDYKKDLIIYINYIIEGVLPLRTNLSSKDLPNERLTHSRYKQLIYGQASSILRSQMDKAKKKRYSVYKRVYSYMIKNHPDSSFVKKKFSELNLKDLIKSKYFKIPDLKNLSINFDERFFNIKYETKEFDSFVSLTSPYFNDKGTRALKINIPLKYHKHSNQIKSEGFNLKQNIQIKKINESYFISLIWYKEEPKKKENGIDLGMDMGYKKLISCSNGTTYNGNLTEVYNKISKKKQGSKAFLKALTYRDNEINRIVNSIDLKEVKTLFIEDLNNVKKGKKYFTNKIQRWSYAKTINKLNNICDEQGVIVVKVSPQYTSQTCSSCGDINKESRNNEDFLCVSCGYEIDADINASINILNRGAYSPSNQLIY